MTERLREMLSGDNGEMSSRRVGYLVSILTLCLAEIFLVSFIGFIVFCNPVNGAFTLPQLVTLFISTSGILSSAVTAGFIFKKGDGNTTTTQAQESTVELRSTTISNKELP